MKQLVVFGTLIVLLACGETETGIRVSGSVENPQEGGFVILQNIGEEGFKNLDSVGTDASGNFSMTVEVKQPEFYRLNFYGRQSVNLILSGDESQVEVVADGLDPNGIRKVTGSTSTDELLRMDSLAMKRNSDFQLLNQEALQARSTGNGGTISDIQDQYYYLLNKHNENMKDLIRAASPSLAALYGINYIDVEKDFHFVDSIASIFDGIYPENVLANDLKKKVDGLRSLAIGQPAPDISLPAPDGEVVKLSSLKGNYVLIDFWAAWCRPCRMENPNVVRLYNQYKDHNFEIYGVSLDRKREAWLKAIEDDGLTWEHVSDLKYFNSEAARTYQINAIPATYLIDPEGKIMAKGLRGATLRAKLQEIFG